MLHSSFISKRCNKTHSTYIAQHVEWYEVSDLPVFLDRHMCLQSQIAFSDGVCSQCSPRLVISFWFKLIPHILPREIYWRLGELLDKFKFRCNVNDNDT